MLVMLVMNLLVYKVPVVVLNFPGFIGDSIVSTSSTLVFRDTSPFLEIALSFSKTKLLEPVASIRKQQTVCLVGDVAL